MQVFWVHDPPDATVSKVYNAVKVVELQAGPGILTAWLKHEVMPSVQIQDESRCLSRSNRTHTKEGEVKQ